MSSTDFEFPEFFSFPPFFTIQPTLSTRDKQLKLWKQLIVTWHHHYKSYILVPNEWPHFENPEIGKHPLEDPEEVAAEFYDWICQRSMVGSVYTVYELTEGEEVQGTDFAGMDSNLFRRALSVLENQGKAQIFQGATSEDDGVKFFAG
eukprot:CAMPEP_0117844480 /NCGR_PEP_ID=MMETSP0949-20121206/17587_1 /TAXON_ID=44440 /ORGANISM="Chattonella subsalsa, Strain CCMP2191" /LENGTH=147 /DNA_ID=CAMNT_0005689631 /DNA_START=17 /DNA_END=461 /DNA_ORIENTATION=+